jgi:hypothetical protein
MAVKVRSVTWLEKVCRALILGVGLFAVCLYGAPARAQMGDVTGLGGAEGLGSGVPDTNQGFESGEMLGPGEEAQPVPGPPNLYGGFTESQSHGSTSYFSPRGLFGAPSAQAREAPKMPENMLQLGPTGSVPRTTPEYDEFHGPQGAVGGPPGGLPGGE